MDRSDIIALLIITAGSIVATGALALAAYLVATAVFGG